MFSQLVLAYMTRVGTQFHETARAIFPNSLLDRPTFRCHDIPTTPDWWTVTTDKAFPELQHVYHVIIFSPQLIRDVITENASLKFRAADLQRFL